MIFVTTGWNQPFDRLIQAVDQWAVAHQRTDLFAQIGNGHYQPLQFPWIRDMDPSSFEEKIRESSLVISHAGMGNIINALRFRKPVILLPRRADLHEMTTDHQLDAVRWLKSLKGVWVAEDEHALPVLIDQVLLAPKIPEGLEQPELSSLLMGIKAFIDGREEKKDSGLLP